MKLGNGEALRTFERLMLIETDECIIWPHSTISKGYGKMTVDGRFTYVHCEALRRTVGDAPPDTEACHGPTCVRACMNPRHLRWDTRSANSLDRHRDGTCTQAKLTIDDVHEIRRLADGRLMLQREIAERYGVSVSLIEYIKARKVWGHLPERE